MSHLYQILSVQIQTSFTYLRIKLIKSVPTETLCFTKNSIVDLIMFFISENTLKIYTFHFKNTFEKYFNFCQKTLENPQIC